MARTINEKESSLAKSKIIQHRLRRLQSRKEDNRGGGKVFNAVGSLHWFFGVL